MFNCNQTYLSSDENETFIASSPLPWFIISTENTSINTELERHGGIFLNLSFKADQYDYSPDATYHQFQEASNKFVFQFFKDLTMTSREYLLSNWERIIEENDSLVTRLWLNYFIKVEELSKKLDELNSSNTGWMIITYAAIQSLKVMKYVLEKQDTLTALMNTSWECAHDYY